MKPKTIHLGNQIKAVFFRWFQFCDGRSTDDLMRITSDFNVVTCKSCLKKMAKNPLPEARA